MEVEVLVDLHAVCRACAAAAGADVDDGFAVFVIGRGSEPAGRRRPGSRGWCCDSAQASRTLVLPEHARSPGPEGPGHRHGRRHSISLPVLARRAADAGWKGLSWAVGVPGSVGGAVRMNAGGHGSDMASRLVRYRWVDLLSGNGATDGVEKLDYGYRSSSVTAPQVVVEAELEVTPGSAEEERAAVASIVRWRREHQPGGSNAGSVFTNPEGDSAGRLIEEAGLKGFRLGSARVSEKHANFIQADKGGRADDVRALMDHVSRWSPSAAESSSRPRSASSASPARRLRQCQ